MKFHIDKDQMREMRFLAPENFDHHDLRQALLDHFGGFTASGSADGCWRDPDTGKVHYDQMLAYTVAAKPTVHNWCALRSILLRHVRRGMDQITVYAVDFDGDAHFI